MKNIKIRSNKMGFTLIELAISMTILTLLVAAVIGMFGRGLNAWRLQEGLLMVNSTLRTGETRISADLSSAALLPDPTVGLLGLAVGNGSVVFQRPLTMDGQLWSGPITIQSRNEDLNGDLILNPGEDANGNGILDRVLERLEDGFGGVPADGDFDDPGETLILCSDIDGAVFALANNQLQVTLTSTHLLDSMANNRMTDTISFSIFLVN